MRCVIVDDELSARSRLRRLLSRLDDVEVVGEAEGGISGLDQITTTRPDLILLDIEMPRLSGFQMLKALPEATMPLVIFVTGYDEHALAAFDAQAVSFLLKPIDPAKLAAALKRSKTMLEHAPTVVHEAQRVTDVVRQAPTSANYIVGRKSNGFILLRPAEVAYFSADGDLVTAHTVSESFQVQLTLNDLEKALAKQRFFRAHRSCLVNLAQVREIQPYFRSSYMLVVNDALHSQLQVSERQSRLLRGLIPGL